MTSLQSIASFVPKLLPSSLLRRNLGTRLTEGTQLAVGLGKRTLGMRLTEGTQLAVGLGKRTLGTRLTEGTQLAVGLGKRTLGTRLVLCTVLMVKSTQKDNFCSVPPPYLCLLFLSLFHSASGRPSLRSPLHVSRQL